MADATSQIVGRLERFAREQLAAERIFMCSPAKNDLVHALQFAEREPFGEQLVTDRYVLELPASQRGCDDYGVIEGERNRGARRVEDVDAGRRVLEFVERHDPAGDRVVFSRRERETFRIDERIVRDRNDPRPRIALARVSLTHDED